MKEDALEWDAFSFGATKEYTAEEDVSCSGTTEQDASYSDARGRHGGGRPTRPAPERRSRTRPSFDAMKEDAAEVAAMEKGVT